VVAEKLKKSRHNQTPKNMKKIAIFAICAFFYTTMLNAQTIENPVSGTKDYRITGGAIANPNANPGNIRIGGVNTVNKGGNISITSGTGYYGDAANAGSISFITNANTNMILNGYGNLGLGGVTSPTAKLHIRAADNNAGIMIDRQSTVDWAFGLLIKVNRDLTKAFVINDKNNNEIFRIYGHGIVNAKKIYAESVEVRPDAMNFYWYDFVLKEDYQLMNLPELETYLKENKHLPDVPSEDEIKENGYDLTDMDGLLLKKIEELTLYIIKQQKEIESLKNTINSKN
jgi:hypothetical protein